MFAAVSAARARAFQYPLALIRQPCIQSSISNGGSSHNCTQFGCKLGCLREYHWPYWRSRMQQCLLSAVGVAGVFLFLLGWRWVWCLFW